ncbi:acid resistance serine protease MarP [Fodinicola feengrottensis]|uniref:Acid resistance serine protease MarP n=1 Tax=Fodinicola feengrottensis TaxID=435914 RepID=A0ABN2I6Z2_9ACTN
MTGSVVDIVLVVVVILFAINGYRQGFVVGLLSFVGFIGGALLGLQLAPLIAERIEDPLWRLVVALVIVFLVASAGQALAVILGSAVRDRLKNRGARTVDSLGGSGLSIIAVLLVGWMVAVPLARAPFPALSYQVNHSAIIPAINRVVPTPVQRLYASFASTIDTGDFPDIFDPLTPTKVPSVAAPNSALANSAVVRAAHPSILKVIGDAPSCSRRLEGSSFVISPHHVLTNAHVVAGVTEDLHIVMNDGTTLPATVVLYNPEHDVAILDVPGLNAPVLSFDSSANNDADAIVLGYPGDGPYTATPARIRDTRELIGPDIYKQQTVHREIFSLRTQVHSGNSGGPLLSTDGQVYGVVFAASLDDADTGYALTAKEVAPDVSAGRNLSNPVSTGTCNPE